MKKNVNTKVIKPPIRLISSGKVFKPSPAFRNKIWCQILTLFGVIWSMVLLSLVLAAGIIFLEDGLAVSTTMAMLFPPTNFWTWVGNLIWMIPAFILTPLYVNRIEYSVVSESGETLPEIYVKKGIIRITRKHVPFRTITNISSVAGPYDRIFGIGTVEIQTAGYSGAQTRAEERLEGIQFYEEVRDFILQELRKYRGPYTTTTEVVDKEEQIEGPSQSAREMLKILREIRDLLRDQKKSK